MTRRSLLLGTAPLLRAADPIAFRLADITSQAGIDFRHNSGAYGAKHLPETMGPGCAFFDYDGDGWLDILLVDGGSLADPNVAARARTRLFRNRGDGTFDDVTGTAGIDHRAYGIGACAADYDNDGHEDV